MSPTDKLRAYLAAGQRLEERASPDSWDFRESNDESRTPYVFLKPGYFFWAQLLDNEVTRLFRTKDNRKSDAEFICDARTRVAVYRQVVEELMRALTGNGRLDICSVENTLALMTEGEGSDPEVYREMARSALVKLREALDRAASLVPGESKL